MFRLSVGTGSVMVFQQIKFKHFQGPSKTDSRTFKDHLKSGKKSRTFKDQQEPCSLLCYHAGNKTNYTFSLHVWCPQCEVISQQLHDQRRVLIRLLAQRVQLCDRVVERRLRQSARAVRRVEYLVVEHGEVECQPEPDRVRRCQLGHGDVRRCLVRDQTVLGCLLAVVAGCEFCLVTVVVTFPGTSTTLVM